MEFPLFLYVGALFLAAVLSTRVMKLIRLPNVTGYIITGILMGPFVFGLFFNGFSFDGIEQSVIFGYISKIGWISNVALGFIAFSIGTSFQLGVIKHVGKRVIVITALESVCASAFVFLALLGLHFIFPDHIKWELVLTLSAIAAATAPAATLMVIKQYKAKGEMVDTLLPVVALDDAAALILFAIFFQIAVSISSGGFSVYAMVVKPLIEIALSLALGAIVGLVVSLLNPLFKSRNNRLILCIVAVFVSLGLYQLFRQSALGGFECSSLLMCMMAGAMYVNVTKNNARTYDVLDRFTSPIYMMFFVLSGASLNLKLLFGGSGLIVLGVAAAYILFRVGGKYVGAFSGASMTHCPKKVRNYLGLALIPQAGVAIGLATTANALFSSRLETAEVAGLVLAIILTSTLIYELFGPMISKFALTRAGDIQKEEANPKEDPIQ